MYVENQIFSKKERMYLKYQEAHMSVPIIWVKMALRIYSKNIPSSTLILIFFLVLPPALD